MAWLETITCFNCGKVSTEPGGRDDYLPTCTACRTKKANEARSKHFAELDQLTIDQRIRKIEEWIYDYKPTYVPPPRF